MVLEDIKGHDADLYAKSQDAQVDEINTAVVAKIFQQAPKEKRKLKPTKDELNEIGRDVYEKYFRGEGKGSGKK